MFKNMKVAVKLGLGFALVLALLVVVVAVGITQLAKLNMETNDITDNKWPNTPAPRTPYKVTPIKSATRKMTSALAGVPNEAEFVRF